MEAANLDWRIWRLVVLEELVTLAELRRSWTILDAARAHDALDAKAALAELVRREAERKAREENGG